MSLTQAIQLMSAKPEQELVANLKLIDRNKEIPYVARILNLKSLKDRVISLYNAAENDEGSCTQLEEICVFLRKFQGLEQSVDAFTRENIIQQLNNARDSEKKVLDRFIKCMVSFGVAAMSTILNHYLKKCGIDADQSYIINFFTGTGFSSLFITAYYALSGLAKLQEITSDVYPRYSIVSAAEHADNYINLYKSAQRMNNIMGAVK